MRKESVCIRLKKIVREKFMLILPTTKRAWPPMRRVVSHVAIPVLRPTIFAFIPTAASTGQVRPYIRLSWRSVDTTRINMRWGLVTLFVWDSLTLTCNRWQNRRCIPTTSVRLLRTLCCPQVVWQATLPFGQGARPQVIQVLRWRNTNVLRSNWSSTTTKKNM